MFFNNQIKNEGRKDRSKFRSMSIVHFSKYLTTFVFSIL